MELDLLGLGKQLVTAVAGGQWWAVVSIFIVAVVYAIRRYGTQIRGVLPDTNPVDRGLTWLLESKPGGWVLNWLTSTAGGLVTALATGTPITPALLGPIALASVTASTLWHFAQDLWTWFRAKKPEVTRPDIPLPPGA
jgi:hypothetical protein